MLVKSMVFIKIHTVYQEVLDLCTDHFLAEMDEAKLYEMQGKVHSLLCGLRPCSSVHPSPPPPPTPTPHPPTPSFYPSVTALSTGRLHRSLCWYLDCDRYWLLLVVNDDTNDADSEDDDTKGKKRLTEVIPLKVLVLMILGLVAFLGLVYHLVWFVF